MDDLLGGVAGGVGSGLLSANVFRQMSGKRLVYTALRTGSAEVSPSLISSITDAVSEEVKAWQARPLDSVYPIIYLDCIHVKVRERAVRVKAVYLAIGVTLAGDKEVLGMWLAQTERAKFWLQVMTELCNWGVQDIFIACVGGRGARRWRRT